MSDWAKSICATWCCFALSVLCAGCREDQPDPVTFSQLPYVRQSQHKELHAEIERLEAEKATPERLDVVQQPDGAHSSRVLAATLIDQLNEICSLQNVHRAEQRIAGIYPAEGFQWDVLHLEGARQVSQQYATTRKAYRELLGRKRFAFHLSVADGLLADLSVLDHASFAHHLEAFVAAEIMAEGEPVAALFPLRNMFHIDALLAAVPSVAARRLAAQLRRESLVIVAALVQHPQCSPLLLNELRTLLGNVLDGWSPDKAAWIGDRALGLHAYELVRDGQLLNVLTHEEIERLKREGELAVFQAAVRKSLDDDEWFYLSTMRRVIETCEQPFCKRLGLFEQINEEVQSLKNTARYPLFAARVLLPKIGAIQRELALDRAYCEAWLIGLQAATGSEVDAERTNPVTGKRYEVVREVEVVRVEEVGADAGSRWPEIVIPLASD